MNNVESLIHILPELALALFSVAVLIGSVFFRPESFSPVRMAFTGVVLSFAILVKYSFGAGHFQLFFGLLAHDLVILFFRALILGITVVVILLSMGDRNLNKEETGEYYFFLLVIAVSMMFAVSSNNLLMIYLTIEAISIVSYIMAGYLRREMISSEAGVKYFLFGALSTGIMLYGISLVYGLFGTLDLAQILQPVAAAPANQYAMFMALALVFVGFAFKCSLAPLHMWTPDVYEGAPTPVAALLSVGPKAVGFALIFRVFILAAETAAFPWTVLAVAIAGLTMTVGNFTALQQTNIKRLLAYSTIAQAGYILIGLSVATPLGIQASLFYILVYAVMNLAAFGAVILISNTTKSEHIDSYAGLYRREPLAALILAVAFLSLAGIPPFVGFFGKFLLLAAAVEKGFFTLAIIAVINSVVALYYYAKVIQYMFLREPVVSPASSTQSSALVFVLVVLTIFTVVLGVYPHPVLQYLANILQLI